MSSVKIWLNRLIPKTYFIYNAVLLAGGTALGQALAILASPILTRQYTPQDFGLLALYSFILTLSLSIGSLRYEAAIPLPESDESAAGLLVLSTYNVLISSVFYGIIIICFGNYLTHIANISIINPFLWMLPLGFLGAGFYNVLNFWALRKKAIQKIATTKLNQGIWQILSQVCLGWMHLGPIGLLGGDIVGRVSGSGNLAIFILQQDRKIISNVDWATIKLVARRYKAFPLLSCISCTLNNLVIQLPYLLLTLYYGVQVTGWYILAQKVTGIPATLICRSISQVYISQTSEMVKTCPKEIKVLFCYVIKKLFIVGVPLTILLGVIAPLFITFIFGSEWEETGKYLNILSISFLISFIASPVGVTLEVLERQELLFIREIIRGLLISGSLIWAGSFNYSSTIAVCVLSIASALGYLVHIFFSWLAIRNLG